MAGDRVIGSMCLACGAQNCRTILDFGSQPAANLLTDRPDASVRTERLALDFCDLCGHAQQGYFYPPEELFSDYLYQSGTSKTLGHYFDWLASAIASAACDGARLLEIASNDGSFLTRFSNTHVRASGVEPARNLVEIARAAGAATEHAFWPTPPRQDPLDFIIAMNVLAHTPHPLEFLKAVRRDLAPSGVAYIQTSQVDMFENFEFDTLYHEHYSFFTPNSLRALAVRAGFSQFRFYRTEVHGGSLLALLSNDAAAIQRAATSILQNAKGGVVELSTESRPSVTAADQFSLRASETCASLIALTTLAQAGRISVVLVGAAAKAVTVLQASGIRPDYVVDEAPLKIGKYLPATALRVKALSSVANIDGPCLFIIGAWNFGRELNTKLRQLRALNEDVVAFYFPRLTLQLLSEPNSKGV